MANVPLVLATVKVTAKDINGNNIAKQYNNVTELNFDYVKGVLRVTDTTGTFYFQVQPLSTVTYTIVTGVTGNHSVVMS